MEELKAFNETEFVEKLEFAPSDPYFLTAATLIIAFLIFLYLWYVFLAGPKYMKTQEPYRLKNTIRYYNVFQLIACSALVVRMWMMGFDHRYIFRCEKFSFLTEAQRIEVVVGAWMFMCLRIFEFIETVFFILRKKQKQASFLHIYHHISTVILMWIWISYDQELMAVYCALINSFVHVIMYTYYFLSSYESPRKALGFVKPIITVIQLVQFFAVMAHCVVAVLPDCGQGLFFYLQFVNLINLTILFGHFFITTYMRKK